jgi:TonB family protein
MKALGNGRKRLSLFVNSIRSDTGVLVKAGIFSLLLHMILIVLLGLSPGSAVPRGESTVYQVTIRALSSQRNSDLGPMGRLSPSLPLLARTQTRREENEWREAITREPVKEAVRPPVHKEEGEIIKEPIPLPMTASSSDTNLDVKKEDDLPILLSSIRLTEGYQTPTLSMKFAGEPGVGQGTPGWGGAVDASGPGGSGYGWKGSQKEAGIGQGGYGWGGSGEGSRPGNGGGGWGGSENNGGYISYPRNAQNPKPLYPLEARERGYQGEVLLRVEVLSNGRVGETQVKKSSGYEVLDQSALATVKQWKFIPARKGEIAIPFWVTIPIKFQLL